MKHKKKKKKHAKKEIGLRRSDYAIPESVIGFGYKRLKRNNLLPKPCNLIRDYKKVAEMLIRVHYESAGEIDQVSLLNNVLRLQMELSWYNFGRRAVVVTTEGLMDILTHVNMDDVRMGDVISWDGEAPEPFMLIIPKCKGESGEREVQECLVAFDNSEPATEAMIVGNDKTTRVVKLDPTCNKRIHISLWGDKAEGYAFFYFKEEKTVGSTIEMSRGDVDEKDCGYLLKTARFVMAVLAYMKACPEKVVKGVRFLDDDNHMSFSFSKLTEPDRVDTSVDGRGEGSHKAPHFRKWHLRRYPVRKDGTRREGLLLIHGCAVGFGSVSAVEN